MVCSDSKYAMGCVEDRRGNVSPVRESSLMSSLIPLGYWQYQYCWATLRFESPRDPRARASGMYCFQWTSPFTAAVCPISTNDGSRRRGLNMERPKQRNEIKEHCPDSDFRRDIPNSSPPGGATIHMHHLYAAIQF